MMMPMPSRVLLALLLMLHTTLGWGAFAQGVGASGAGRTILIDPCGDECCCGPSHCPCVYELPVPGSNTPTPAVPSQRGDHDGPRLSTPRPDPITPVIQPEDDSVAHAWATLHARPAGDLSRRVMQLQCVWRH